MTSKNKENIIQSEERKPPVFSRWRGWYLLVLGALVTYIILLYAFSNLY